MQEGEIFLSKINRLSKVFHSAAQIPYSNQSRIVIMSDCHRGDGDWADNFSNNQNLFFAALSYYYDKEYTYIELGDGDELWENRNYKRIISTHSDAFWLMSKFYQEGRFYMLYGNHDIVKSKEDYMSTNCSWYFDESTKQEVPLFPKIIPYEGLVLTHVNAGHQLFLTHGHQVDFINSNLWKLTRFLVRYLWRPLELVGFHDPTSTAKNHEKKVAVEKSLMKWSEHNHTLLIAGHTHRPVFPKVGEPLYFNDGSCVHPRCITALEIEDDAISLVKWVIKPRKNRSLYIERVLLEGPVKIEDFYRGKISLSI